MRLRDPGLLALLTALATQPACLLADGDTDAFPAEQSPGGNETGLQVGQASTPDPRMDHDAWLDMAADPLAEHRPPNADCDPYAARLESGTLEVDTGLCSYLSVEQDVRGGFEPGVRYALHFWHDRLVAEEPAEAHVAVLQEGRLVWETHIPIPSLPMQHEASWVATEGGQRLGLHMHNHGANTWNFWDLRRQP